MKTLQEAKVAIVCDWLTNQGGAEKVILGLHQLFPSAPIFTSLYNPEKLKGFEEADIRTSYLQKIPFFSKRHQLLLSFMPKAFESFDLNDYDIIISSSHSCAKGVLLKPETMHMCYCHSPMRYAWNNHQKYIDEYKTNQFVKKVGGYLIHKIRLWDRINSDRVDYFIANSDYIQGRIQKFYRRKSITIHPFIEPEIFHSSKKEDFYIAVGRLTAYKKFELIVDTFNKNGLPIKICGTGSQSKYLKEKAKKNIEFLGFVPDKELRDLYSRAKALIFPQFEDFGIIPVEAMASGCPVLAYGVGGSLETVIHDKTGLHFPEQTVESLNNAIQEFQQKSFNTEEIIKHSQKFAKEEFDKKLISYLDKKWNEHQLTFS